ncbi:MAG: hypothetical protein VB021_07490 [Oscillospiraceae bacterium]|nr:hypothetical protein [Oscillospiraceae bacterium]
MNKFNKWGALIVAAVMVAVFVVAFFGVSTKYGDIETVIIGSQKNISYGNDLDGSIEYILSSKNTDYKPTAEELAKVKAIVEKRLSAYVVPECEVSCDYDAGTVRVRIPYSSRSVYSPSAFNDVLTTVGSFAVYKGSEADESMLIFTDAQVTSAKTKTSSILNGLSYTYSVEGKLNAEGKAALKKATQELVDAASQTDANQSISFWLDGEKLTTTNVKSVISNGAFSLSSYNFKASDVSNYSIMLSGGSMPYEVACASVRSARAQAGSAAITVLGIALAASVLFACIYLILRYRLCGVASLIGLIGTLGGLLLVVTGMFTTSSGTPLLLSGVFAIAAVLLLCLEANARFFNAFTEEMKTTTTVSKAANTAFRQTIGATLAIDVIVLLAAVAMLLFGRNAAAGAWILSPVFKALSLKTADYYELAYVGKFLLTGTLIGLLCSVFAVRYIVYSFELWKAGRNPFAFGGAKK